MKRFKLYPMFLYPLIALYQLEVVPKGYVDLGMKFVYSKNVYSQVLNKLTVPKKHAGQG